ncbi:MAG: GNAT family N-acetyltransferase [Bacillota bacterium]
MITLDEALELLKHDKIRNASMINFIKEYSVQSIDICGDSLMLRATSDHQWILISSESKEELNVLINKLDKKDEYFSVIEDWMMPILTHGREVIWSLSCVKLYYPEELNIVEPQNKVSELNAEMAEYIFDNSKYKEFTSIEYITDRINRGTALGIFDKDKLAAWLLTHDDGAMGFLHVLEEYRGKGYAQDLTYAMIKALRDKNQLPFVQIEESNVQSMGLSQKMGFVRDRVINWFQLR